MMNRKVINLGKGRTATLSIDIGYFPEKVEETEAQSVKKFGSILSSLINSTNLTLTSDLSLRIHSSVALPASHDGVTYQCQDGLSLTLFADEVANCKKYQDKPHYHYLCKVVKDSEAGAGTISNNKTSLTIAKRVKGNDSETTASVDKPNYGDFLKISDLLRNICSYLKLDDLKNFSVLSKDMRQLVLPSLISSSALCISNKSQIDDFLAFMQIKIQPLNKNIPLCIDSKSLQNCSDSSAALLKLFTGFGPLISHLHLFVFYDEKYNGFQENTSVPVLGPKLFPQLNSLRISLVNFITGTKLNGQDKYKTYAPLIKSILLNAPELNAIELSCDSDKWISSSLFRLVGESGLAITNLKVSSAFPTDENLAYLSRFDLQELKFSCVGVFESQELECESLTNFLESQSHSLKHLRLTNSIFTKIPRITFPRMEMLETLKIKGDFGRGGPLDPIDLNQLPNLKKIELKMDGPSVHDFFLNVLDKCDMERESKVKEVILKIPGISAGSVRNCANAFKSLKKLEVPFDESFKSVWKDLASLEELTLFPPEKEVESNDMFELMGAVWIDEGIAGVGKISQSKRFTDEDIEKYMAEYNPDKSIASMKKLQLLRLRPAPQYNLRLMLTNVSFRVAFSKMESLKSIDFCGTHPAFVGASRKVLNEIGQKIALLFGNGRDWYYQ